MPRRLFAALLTFGLCVAAGSSSPDVNASASLQSPERFLGFPVGADNKIARWDRIVEYMKLAASSSDRVRYRELGRTTNGNEMVVLEISAPDTLKRLDHFKQLQRKLYFQGGAPTDAEREEIFRQGKVVVLVTCSVHATELGATQMSLELVHRLATEDSPAVRRILDNVIFLLVPSLNPDGQIIVTDWFNKNVGTPYDGSPLPFLYHPYVGHDNNRDMYMLTQKESQYIAQLAWHDWFPAVWLDEHQMGQTGPRIFVMPATDPINPNVHPLIYRWNGILGQAQAAALEAAGKPGIIYNAMYTNFWEGAMAWSGWWHNQIGLLTEVASARLAAPTEQQRAVEQTIPDYGDRLSQQVPTADAPPRRDVLPPPSDTTPRTIYPRPWLGGRWTLRDIVDYDLIATMALLDATASMRETLLRQLYEVNRATVETPRSAEPTAILIPTDQYDPREADHLVDKLRLGGVETYRSESPMTVDGRSYAPGTFVVPMAQVFGRYARDMLERQVYPEVRRGPDSSPDPPYDVTAWSLGLLLGVETASVHSPVPASAKLTLVTATPQTTGEVAGNGQRFTFSYKGPDTAIAINRLLTDGAHVAFDGPSRVVVTGIRRKELEAVVQPLGISAAPADAMPRSPQWVSFHAPRIGLYQPFTGGNMDEGWTRWVLEQYGFTSTPIHNADIKSGGLRSRFDAIIIADQNPRDIVNGFDTANIRPEYRGGIGEAGVDSLKQFVAAGGTLITLGAACDLVIDRLPVAVRDMKRALTRDQQYAPGAILRVEVDGNHPIGYGVPSITHGFYINGPFFATGDSFTTQRVSVVARFPNTNVLASGWLRGEEVMAGRAAVVSIEMNPGRIVLFGLRPQHRAQTHATFPMLFNALYLSATDGPLPASLTE